MAKIRKWLTYDYVRETDPEIPQGVSLTVPDQTLSIPEMLSRFARGIPVTGFPDLGYDAYDDSDWDDFLPDPRTLDISERAELAEMVKEQLREMEKKAAQRKKDDETALQRLDEAKKFEELQKAAAKAAAEKGLEKPEGTNNP